MSGYGGYRGGGGGGYGGNPYAQQDPPAYGRGGGNPYAQQDGPPYGRGGGGNPYAQQGGGGGNPYSQQQGGGGGNPYAQQGGGGGGNRYAQQNPYAQQDDYGGRPAAGGYGQSSEIEMGRMAGGGGGGGGGSGNAILDECKRIDGEINGLENLIRELKATQNASLQSSSQNPDQNREMDRKTAQIATVNRGIVDQIKKVKKTPGAGNGKNAKTVNRVNQRLNDTFQQYQREEMEYRRKFRDQLVRQYRIVNPNASEAEARDAAENPQEGGVFAQALLQSNRRGQAQTALSNVRSRHEAIQNVERQMIELGELFDQMNKLVAEQDVAVERIAEQTEQVTTDLTNGNTQLSEAIVKTRARNKKKWWCLLICIIILLVIVAVVVYFVFHNQGKI